MIDVDKNGLPENCYSVLPSTNEVVFITRYEKGYCAAREENLPWYGQGNADAANEKLGVSKDQELAMLHGSMFGWDKIGAKPETWRLKLTSEQVDKALED